MSARKPFYKRWKFYAYIVAAVVIIGVIVPKEDAAEDNAAVTPVAKAEATPVAAKPADVKPKPQSRDAVLRKLVKTYAEKYDGSEIGAITASDASGDYVLRVDMTFDRKNSAKMSREMIVLYSNDLAANLAKEADVSGVTVFWELPRFKTDGAAAKFTFERAGEDMRLADSEIAVE